MTNSFSSCIDFNFPLEIFDTWSLKWCSQPIWALILLSWKQWKVYWACQKGKKQNSFKSFVNLNDFLRCSSVEKAKALALVLHCADISHPGKPWTIHHAWTQSLMEEFFKQGEKEKELGLPCSPLCDRDNTLVAESQIGKDFNVSSRNFIEIF